MTPARCLGVATLALFSSCAAPSIAPAHALASSPVHYELRTDFAKEPAFEANEPSGVAGAGARKLRVSCHLAWIEDRLAEELFPGSGSGLIALALSPDEGRRLIAALASLELSSAQVLEGECARLSKLDEDEYLVGYDIDVSAGQKIEKSLTRKAAGGTKVELVARASDGHSVDVDAAFTYLVQQVAVSIPDLPPDRVAIFLDLPIIVGQQLTTRISVPLGGTVLLGGFRLMDTPSLRGGESIFRELGSTLFAFVTVEPVEAAG